MSSSEQTKRCFLTLSCPRCHFKHMIEFSLVRGQWYVRSKFIPEDIAWSDTNECMHKIRSLAIKHDRLAGPEVVEQPLESLFLWREVGGEWFLDSVEIVEPRRPRPYTCYDCGITFLAEKRIISRTRRFCPKCSLVRAKENKKNCLICGKEFTPKNATMVYCGQVCAHKAFLEQHRSKQTIENFPSLAKEMEQEALAIVNESERIKLVKLRKEHSQLRKEHSQLRKEHSQLLEENFELKKREKELRRRIRSLRTRISYYHRKEVKLREELKKRPPTCRVCGTPLSTFNTYPSQFRKENICRSCHLQRMIEYYEKKKRND